VDFLHFRSNKTGSWTCRLKHIRDCTPIKENRTILATLSRCADFVTKENEGNPQKYRVGKGKAELVERQRHKYIYHQDLFCMWLCQQCQFTQPAVSFDTAQQCRLTLLSSVVRHSTLNSTRSIYKEKNKEGTEHPLDELSPKGGDTSQPSLLVEVVSIKPLAITEHLRPVTIQPITATTTDTLNTSKEGKEDNTHSACQAVPGNSPKGRPADVSDEKWNSWVKLWANKPVRLKIDKIAASIKPRLIKLMWLELDKELDNAKRFERPIIYESVFGNANTTLTGRSS
jgi:hypothetical protein